MEVSEKNTSTPPRRGSGEKTRSLSPRDRTHLSVNGQMTPRERYSNLGSPEIQDTIKLSPPLVRPVPPIVQVKRDTSGVYLSPDGRDNRRTHPTPPSPYASPGSEGRIYAGRKSSRTIPSSPIEETPQVYYVAVDSAGNRIENRMYESVPPVTAYNYSPKQESPRPLPSASYTPRQEARREPRQSLKTPLPKATKIGSSMNVMRETGAQRPDYASMTDAERGKYEGILTNKLSQLRDRYKDWEFPDFLPGCDLDTKHETYEGYINNILIHLNTNQWRNYISILFLSVEGLCSKGLGIDMGTGQDRFSVVQMQNVGSYDHLLTELGEKYYILGNKGWAPETKIISSTLVSAAIFVIVGVICKWIGVDSPATIRRAIQSMVNGSLFESGSDLPQAPKVDAHGNPVEDAPSPAATGGGIGDILGGLFRNGGGGGGGLANLLVNLGGAAMNNQQAAPKPAAAAPIRPRF